MKLKCPDCHTSICVKCGASHSFLLGCESAMDSAFETWRNRTRNGCKRCPNCKFHIEKSMGCDHMTCSRCRHEFCWKCMAAFVSGSCGRRNSLIPCRAVALWNGPVWGASPVQRVALKSLACVVAAPACGLVAGVGAAAAGCAIATGAVTIPVASLLAGARIIQQGVYNMSRCECPVIVHIPWTRRAPWCIPSGDGNGESEAATYLQYEGRYHPCGVFVTRTVLTSSTQQSLKRWLIDGPARWNNSISVVIYFVPNGTSSVTLRRMIPEYEDFPTTASPGITYSYSSGGTAEVAQRRLESRIVQTLNNFSSSGKRIPNCELRGLIDDPMDYGLPEPESEQINASAFDIDIKRCEYCAMPKYFTNMKLYNSHMLSEHEFSSS
mmetsp:Transcript_15759/g.23689  ORF Transcript_15759/g.23689 Transcript_15759/m.23689 type:complete len:381 (-) Transcript_15759:110-1252(-)